ncbi:MAG TPA: ADP-ribosylglycohydrolase family protein [Armatimonadota bacterium]
MTTAPIATRLSACLLGAAVGDALGLPREGLTRQRAALTTVATTAVMPIEPGRVCRLADLPLRRGERL